MLTPEQQAYLTTPPGPQALEGGVDGSPFIQFQDSYWSPDGRFHLQFDFIRVPISDPRLSAVTLTAADGRSISLLKFGDRRYLIPVDAESNDIVRSHEQGPSDLTGLARISALAATFAFGGEALFGPGEAAAEAAATTTGAGAFTVGDAGAAIDHAAELISAGAGGAADVAAGAADLSTAGIGAAAAGAAGTAGDAASSSSAAAAGAAANTASNAASAASDATQSIASSIKGSISELSHSIGDFVKPITDSVHAITDTVRQINDEVIKPIVDPIVNITQSVKTLSDEIHRDIQGGVMGLLRIPQDITNAFDSVDATLQRSLTMLGQSQAQVTRDVLVPGMAASIGTPITKSVTDLSAELGGKNVERSTGQADHIGVSADERRLIDSAKEAIEKYEKTEGFWGTVLHLIFGNLQGLAAALGMAQQWLETAKHIGQMADKSERMAPTQAATAFLRGLIDQASFYQECGWAGVNEQRANILFELQRTLLGPTDLIEMYHKDLIGEAEAVKGLAALGYAREDIPRLLAAAQKGPTIADWIYNIDRRVAITQYGAPATLNAPAPAELIARARALGISSVGAQVAWENHWVLLSAADGVQAYFRGYINKSQLESILRFNALAPEQWQNFIDLQRPEIPTISIPTLISEGIISENEASDVLRRRGMSDYEANLIIKRATAGKKAATASGDTHLHGLTAAAVSQLYEGGTIEREAAAGLLGRLGLGDEAVQLSLNLIDLRSHIAERKAATDLTIARQGSGEISFEEAQHELAALGLTPTEMAKAVTLLERQQLTRTKLPGEGAILDMFHRGVLSRVDAFDTLGLLGFSAFWSEKLLQLEEAKHARA
jgi:Holliday junction resolvasome RuvABC DNA-binding subunit